MFISHASEDKDAFVRPLAEQLRSNRVEVWFDEFTLTVGTSLRTSIDLGLSRSRFGIVVLSPSFFGKSWPEWELSGLVQRHLSGSRNVILPIWHGVDKAAVAGYSPSLADIVGVRTSDGLEHVVRRLLKVIQPEESALVTARDIVIRCGADPPVISDDWWLDVIEGTGWQDHRRWCLPVWRMTTDASSRGEELAWIVMQHLWQNEAEDRPITQMTPPDEVLRFICHQAGLLSFCRAHPEALVGHAPQLTIPGKGGVIEEVIEEYYQRSVAEWSTRRQRGDKTGTALTKDNQCPTCGEEVALRHPTFGNHKAAFIACGFVQGFGAGLGPHTRAFSIMDYAVWFLSEKSSWLPPAHHTYLLQGMKDWAQWLWMQGSNGTEYNGPCNGALGSATDAPGRFKMTASPLTDLTDRIDHSRNLLGLPEPTSVLVTRFLEERFIEHLVKREAQRRRIQNHGKAK